MRYKQKKDIYAVLAERIAAVLTENGDADKAVKNGVSLFNQIRGGKVATDTLYNFAEYYGVSLDYLFGRTDVYSVIGIK